MFSLKSVLDTINAEVERLSRLSRVVEATIREEDGSGFRGRKPKWMDEVRTVDAPVVEIPSPIYTKVGRGRKAKSKRPARVWTEEQKRAASLRTKARLRREARARAKAAAVVSSAPAPKSKPRSKAKAKGAGAPVAVMAKTVRGMRVGNRRRAA